jgi:hypothetical protein
MTPARPVVPPWSIYGSTGVVGFARNEFHRAEIAPHAVREPGGSNPRHEIDGAVDDDKFGETAAVLPLSIWMAYGQRSTPPAARWI